MLSSRVRLPRAQLSIAAVCTVALAACVGTLEEKTPQQSGGASSSSVDAGGGAAACDDLVPPTQSGKHNPGTACQMCHGAGRGAPTFTLAGTLYDGVGSDVPVAGATIHIVDANGSDVSLTSAENGNFWSSQPIAFPITTYASGCPDRIEMITPVSESGADCNAGGCHVAGFRVHLP